MVFVGQQYNIKLRDSELDDTMFRSVSTKFRKKLEETESQSAWSWLQIHISQFLRTIRRHLMAFWWRLFVKIDLRKVPQPWNSTANVTEESLIIYKAYLDQRLPQQTVIRILAFSRCRNLSVVLRYHSLCISAKEVTVEYDCPWKWGRTCKWFSFLLLVNMEETNFSSTTVSTFLSCLLLIEQ
ncbi:unnamed protein product [Gongylonema pulchrum]|uniref:RGS domain-containing protein n=1 Tax=Gongylonema pulchrum TaxID=637853 RepID=A0A183D3J9_9BILA|nr:unnamed protein product [Gongylonema pulchrum]